MEGERARGWLYDGRSANRHEVGVSVEDKVVRLDHGDGTTERIDPGLLLHADEKAGAQIYGRSDRPGWRLSLPTPIPASLASQLPGIRRYGRWIDRVGLLPALAIALVVSGSVLAASYAAPALLAPIIPQSWEQRYGDAIVGDFGGKFCRGPGGQEALERLAARLAPGGTRFDVRVVNVGMVNAAALPGNHIVIFRELIDDASGPDEVAGVLAHEIAHVSNRHVTEGMIRELGFGMVITALGGTTAGNADLLIGSRYSRGAEAEADRDAVSALARAGISPLPTARFFTRLGRGEKSLGRVGETLSYVSTHPLSNGRSALFEASHDKRRAYTPALDRADWDALVEICRNDPARRS